MNCESLIFDIDGTLWDSRQLVAEGYNIQLEREGLNHLFVNADILKPLFGKTMTEIADVLLASIDISERYDLRKMSIAGKFPGFQMFPDEKKGEHRFPASHRHPAHRREREPHHRH